MSTLDFSTPVVAAPAVAADLEALWASGLQASALTKIQPRWNTAVGSADLWLKNVATPSNANWKGFVNPNFSSKSGRVADVIKGTQLKKLTRAYTKAQAAHDAQFAGGAALFQAAVTAKRGNWTANAANTLGLTGDRLLGTRGPTSQHVRVATADSTYLRDASSPASGTFDPTILTIPEVPYLKNFLRPQFKAAFEGYLIQIGVFLLTGDITDPAIYNTALDQLLTGFLSTGTPAPPAQFIHFEVAGGVVLHTHLDNGGITL